MFYPLWLVFICVIPSESSEILTTTRTYELDVPGSSSIKIIEGDSPWKNDMGSSLTQQHRAYKHSFTTDKTDSNFEDSSNEENFSHQALEEFLNTYAEKLRKKQYATLIDNSKYVNINDEKKSQPNDVSHNDKEEKSKHWNLLNIQKHKHPFEDKNGWVSLDPVPWSLSKISKWQSEKKPVKHQASYGSAEIPSDDDLETSDHDELPSKPSWYQKPRPYKVKPLSHYKPSQIQTYIDDNDDEPDNYYQSRPSIFQKPQPINAETFYGQVQYDVGHTLYGSKKKKRPGYTHSHDNFNQNSDCDHSQEIITDGQPADFPTYHHNRRKSSEIPETHPFSGNGNWVLLSTTKGFKGPQNRKRSLQLPSNGIQNNPDSVGFRKGVQLTVLPPLKNSKINMTTSHGGILQVESTFETVEQAQQRHARKLKAKEKKRITKLNGLKNNKVVQKQTVQKLNVALPISAMTKRVSNPDISTVLAAAGAGMIPATMAMLVPMAMSGKRRKRHLKFPYIHHT
ncbi:hypothetical protein HHI36_011389 [Cryptolaemus montrouzieri]|uniref:Uncharacterized protein n=1 Tax=Cryptolaemus montrouzieri TaxID=559131 RepID=A0ABD2MLJ9_9CUCU